MAQPGRSGTDWYQKTWREQQGRPPGPTPRPPGPAPRPPGPAPRPPGPAPRPGPNPRPPGPRPRQPQDFQNNSRYQNPDGRYNPNDYEEPPRPQYPQDHFVPDPEDQYREPPNQYSESETQESNWSEENRTEWERALREELRLAREENARIYNEFQEYVEAQSRPPMPRAKSLFDIGKEEKEKVDAKYPFGSKFSMLPPQQQQVANLDSEITERQKMINMMASVIALNDEDGSEADKKAILNQMKKQYQESVGAIHHLRKDVDSAKTLASKFETCLDMPNLDPPPPDFRRDPKDLDFLNILKYTGKFNPSSTNEAKFRHYWDKILVIGQDKYYSEADYKKILSYVLHGEALSDLKNMNHRGASLEEIVNRLATLYDQVDTIDDHKHNVDNFVRQKNETVSKAMTRAKTLIEKLAPLHSRAAWPEKCEDMGKAILKQIVNQDTRVALDMEEQKMIRAGASLSLKQMTNLAFDHEKYNKLIPTKDVATTFQVASMTPRAVTGRDEEKAFLRKELSITKTLDEKLSKLAEQNEEVLQIAAANFANRGRTSEKFSKNKYGDKPTTRSLSWHQRKKAAEGAMPDGDELMQFDDSPVSADKPQGQGFKKQFPQKPLVPQKQQWQKPQQQQQQQQQWKSQKQDQQPQEVKPKFYQKDNPGVLNKNGFPKTSFAPKMFHQNGYHYFQCACSSWHLQGSSCPKQQFQSNVIQMTEDDDDEEEQEEHEDDAQFEDSEN